MKNNININNPTKHNEGPKPRAKLISWTPDPINLIYQVWEFAKTNDGLLPATEQTAVMQSFPRCEPNYRLPLGREEETEFFKRMMLDWTGIPEMALFTFAFFDIPVALLGQLARHRFGKLFVRSARVFPAGKFADEERFFTPDSCSLAEDEARNSVYRRAMESSQAAYNELIELGVPCEDARGVLPMHGLYDMCFAMDLRSLAAMVQKRTCLILQQQYWAPLLSTMRKELCERVDDRLEFIFKPPCEFRGKCISPMEQELRVQGKDPNPPCPLYANLP